MSSSPLAEVGVELVDDVAPFERRKLWLLNGPHSAVAYGGLLAGFDTIAHAVADPTIARFVRQLVEDTLEVAEFPATLKPTAFADDALRRFANPTLGHTCAQVGADGSSKLPQRLLPVVAARRERALETSGFALVVAIWLAATAGVEVRGVRLPCLEDPRAGQLRDAASRGSDLRQLCDVALAGHTDDAFITEVASALEGLTREGRALAGGSMVTTTRGGPGQVLPPEEVRAFVRSQVAGLDLAGRSLCLVIPDATRSCPLPLLLGAVEEGVGGPRPLLHRGGRTGDPRADDRGRHCRPGRPPRRTHGEPRLVGGRHLHPGRSPRLGARARSSPAGG